MLDPARLAILRPDAIVARLALAHDAVVADVGAGPGAFTRALAEAVPRGRVIATDVDATALLRVAADAAARGERNVDTRVVGREAHGLGSREGDLAFLCQVGHYQRDSSAYLSALEAARRPGGRGANVNNHREREGNERTAAALGWRELDRWTPAEGFFGRVYAPTTTASAP
jgi:SAM-dependent methyltransferase